MTDQAVTGVEIGDRDVVVVRHGATEWSRNGRHTGRTDLPLLPEGERAAATIATRLSPTHFALVLTSPLLRARETCRLAGLADTMVVDDDLGEWDYGDYEGLTTPQIRELTGRADWDVWNGGPMPDGESLEQVGARVDRVIERALATGGRVAIFGHGHCSRILIARWLGMEPRAGASFRLETATLSVLGYERERRVLSQLNA